MKVGTPPNAPSGDVAARSLAASNPGVAMALILSLTASARVMAASVASSDVSSPFAINCAVRTPSTKPAPSGVAFETSAGAQALKKGAKTDMAAAPLRTVRRVWGILFDDGTGDARAGSANGLGDMVVRAGMNDHGSAVLVA